MSRGPTDKSDLDRVAYELAGRHFDAVQTNLPPEAIQRLAKEVVRRLAFRFPRVESQSDGPTPTQIDRLCAALISEDERAGDRAILALRRRGSSAEVLLLDYIGEAARRLGEMWEADEVTFAEVTLGTSRLYRIIRGLRHVVDEVIHKGEAERHILFALVPDESHTLGIEIASELFIRQGWDVDMAVGDDHEYLVKRMEADSYRSLVFVAHSEAMLSPLIALIVSARILQPMATIVVAGNIVDQIKDVDHLVGADAVMPDIETAVSTLGSILRTEAKD